MVEVHSDIPQAEESSFNPILDNDTNGSFCDGAIKSALSDKFNAVVLYLGLDCVELLVG